jgi:uncharacterized membrane protein YcjF (UPF0283 family)
MVLKFLKKVCPRPRTLFFLAVGIWGARWLHNHPRHSFKDEGTQALAVTAVMASAYCLFLDWCIRWRDQWWAKLTYDQRAQWLRAKEEVGASVVAARLWNKLNSDDKI